MDNIDLKIIDILTKNSRETVSEISHKVHLSLPAVSERIRKLEENNIIENFTIKVNREKSDYKLLVNIFVNINKTENIEPFRKKIVKFQEVLECYHIVGEYDYLLKVLLRDTSELEHFISEKLKKIKGVSKTNTIIILSTLKEKLNRGEIE